MASVVRAPADGLNIRKDLDFTLTENFILARARARMGRTMQERESGGTATVELLTQRVAALQHAIAEHERGKTALRSENETLRTDNLRLRAQLSKMLKEVFGKSAERMDSAQLRMAFASLLDDAAKALLEENAKKKLNEKNLDLVVANTPLGLDSLTNQVTIINKEGDIEVLPLLGKIDVADRILDRVVRMRD